MKFEEGNQWRIQRGAEGTFAPPPPKIGQKKKKCSNSLFFNFLWLKMQNFLGSLRSPTLYNIIIDILLLFFQFLVVKMQNFLGSLRSPTLYNIIIDILLLKNLENNTFSYILPSFYTGEGNFDMKMQDLWALKSLNSMSFRGASPPSSAHQGSALDLTGDIGGPQTPRRISPPLTQKTWIRAWQ